MNTMDAGYPHDLSSTLSFGSSLHCGSMVGVVLGSREDSAELPTSPRAQCTLQPGEQGEKE